uniref:Uncharacterized protein n=1 Tax=Oryza brachyantha TaxID=4533 RepID=J3NDN4_ORYBR
MIFFLQIILFLLDLGAKTARPPHLIYYCLKANMLISVYVRSDTLFLCCKMCLKVHNSLLSIESLT